jgi:hypothetical protein
MKLSVLSLCTAIVLSSTATQAASTVMNMTFAAGGANINETTGWNGTTAPGGFLASGLSVVSGMQILGTGYSNGSIGDMFHVDGWNTTTSTTGYVGFTIGNGGNPLVNFSLSGETFSTRMHYHYLNPANQDKIFNAVELLVNGNSAGSQAFNYLLGPQTLNWTMPSGLDALTSASFELRFTGGTSPSNGSSGPEWSLLDNAFVSFNGTVVPEPSRALLCLAGFMCLALRRRK